MANVPGTSVARPSPTHNDDIVRPTTLLTGWPPLVIGMFSDKVEKAGRLPTGAGLNDNAPSVNGAAPTAIFDDAVAVLLSMTAVAVTATAPEAATPAGLTVIAATPAASVSAEPEAGVNSTRLDSLAVNLTMAPATGVPAAVVTVDLTVAL